MSEVSNPVILRECGSKDVNFILHSWLRTYKHRSDFAKMIRNDIFFKWHREIILNILKRSKTLVACYPEMDDLILRYLVYEKNDPLSIIHFTYVKLGYRKLGIAHSLINQSEIDLNQTLYTHKTYDGEEILKKYPKLIYDPYRI